MGSTLFRGLTREFDVGNKKQNNRLKFIDSVFVILYPMKLCSGSTKNTNATCLMRIMGGKWRGADAIYDSNNTGNKSNGIFLFTFKFLAQYAIITKLPYTRQGT